MEIELTAGETVRAISAIVSIHEEEHGEDANTPRGTANDNDMLNVRVDANVHRPNPPATLTDSNVP